MIRLPVPLQVLMDKHNRGNELECGEALSDIMNHLAEITREDGLVERVETQHVLSMVFDWWSDEDRKIPES